MKKQEMSTLNPQQEQELDALLADIGQIETQGLETLDEELFFQIMVAVQTFGRSITKVDEKEHIKERQQLLRDKKVQEY